MLLFLISYNLKMYYNHARYWYNDLTSWIVSLVMEIVLSFILLGILSTIVL